ncbi:hypothetical protein YC2023_023992 [Brassica napus]
MFHVLAVVDYVPWTCFLGEGPMFPLSYHSSSSPAKHSQQILPYPHAELSTLSLYLPATSKSHTI